jgi:FtsH-binding integral membrane protein
MARLEGYFTKAALLVGLPAVALVTFSLPYLLEQLGLNVLRHMVLSPLYVLPVCVVFFIVEVVRLSAEFRKAKKSFTQALVLWAAAGAGLSLFGVVAMTVVTGSPQGPLALIFYGPAGVAVGCLFGTGLWRLNGVVPDRPLHDGHRGV